MTAKLILHTPSAPTSCDDHSQVGHMSTSTGPHLPEDMCSTIRAIINRPVCPVPVFFVILLLCPCTLAWPTPTPLRLPSSLFPPVTLETDTKKALQNPTTRRGSVVTPTLALPRAFLQGSEKDSQRDERRYRNSPRPTLFFVGFALQLVPPVLVHRQQTDHSPLRRRQSITRVMNTCRPFVESPSNTYPCPPHHTDPFSQQLELVALSSLPNRWCVK